MIPVIAIIGRQNVGKSTLFNRMTRTRDALVANFPGLTRDRKYGRATWEGHEFIVVDTGGFFDSDGEEGVEEGVKASIAVQSRVAIEESDLVLFVVDSQSGLMAMDLSIAEYLRRCEKTTIIVANKKDLIDINSAIIDFYALGMGTVLPISASHGHGINSLVQKILPLVPPRVHYGLPKASCKSGNNTLPIKIAIVGRPNVGKSTLTNRFIGEERVIVFDMPDTTRDSIYIPLEREGKKYVIIDTAGVLKKNKVTEPVKIFSIIKTLQSIEDSNVVLMVINACDGLFDQDLSLISFILNSGRAMVIAVNKWDVLSSADKNKIKEVLNIRLKFIDFARVHFISAVNLKKNQINKLFESVNEAYQCATKRINTAKLTRILHMAVDKYQPPLIHGHRAKAKYAHIGGYNPLLVVLHGTQLKDLPDAYKRYLINYFRRSLNIIGTPIHIQLNEGTNPFSGRRNMLTQRQIRKRKRFLIHLSEKK